MGLRNAPSSFSALVEVLLRGISYKYVVAYIDDICCFSPTFESHLQHLREIFTRLRQANLKLKPSKCYFALKKIHFLGHVLQAEGVSPNPDKIESIKSYPVPQKVKDVRSFLGLVGFYRRMIPAFGSTAKPLYNLTKKDVPFLWSDECQKAFDQLKAVLTSDSVVAYPDFSKPFILSTDASTTAIAGVLSQQHESGIRPVAFCGRALSPAETRYSITEQELLAVVFSVQHFKVYLEGSPFELQTDHSALKWILTTKDLVSPRLTRWALFLQGFTFTVTHLKGKLNIVPDALSRRQYDYCETRADKAINEFPDVQAIQPCTESEEEAFSAMCNMFDDSQALFSQSNHTHPTGEQAEFCTLAERQVDHSPVTHNSQLARAHSPA